MACCVILAALLGVIMTVKAALLGRSRGSQAQEWRLKDKDTT